MSRFRLYPSAAQAETLLSHCADARYVWNLAVEQHGWWTPARTRRSGPSFVAQCRQLTEARAAEPWLAAGSVNVQQQALRDFNQAKTRFFKSGFGHPSWRKKFRHEGFRITDTCDVQKLNRRWAQVKVPKIGWVRFRLTTTLPDAKSYRVTFRDGQWHVSFPRIPDPIPAPGNGSTVGVDRGVTITAALSDGRTLNCPRLSVKERAKIRKHQRRAARAPRNSQRKTAEYAKVSRVKAHEADRRKDWVEKTSTGLARQFDLIRLEDLRIKNMTRKPEPKPDPDQPGSFLPNGARAKAGLNRAILAQGWGLLAQRLEHKAAGRVEKVPAPYTSLRCSDCGWIDKDSRQNQAAFLCVSCGFALNADVNAALNIAAGHAGGATPRQRSSVREPQQPALAGVGIPRL